MFRVFAAEACSPVRPQPAGKRNLEDNYRAVDEAAALHADSLVLVVGGGAEVGLGEARKMVADGVAALVPYARQHGVKLGLEPLHPMYAAERSVLNTIGQALELGLRLYTPGSRAGPRCVSHLVGSAGARIDSHDRRGRIYGFHVNDWLVPLPDLLLGRGMMGDGVIDNRMLRLGSRSSRL